MYAIMTRRTMNREHQQETMERGARDFLPKLQEAPGFVAFYLVAGEDGINTAFMLWEERVQGEAFMSANHGWRTTLEEWGHRLESEVGGDVVQQVLPGQ